MMIVLMLLLSYLIGAFPSGYVVGKLFLKDIRQFGSGNTGATNSFRVLGKPAGFSNISRHFKGFITVFFPIWLPVHADGPLSTFYPWTHRWFICNSRPCLSCLS